MGSMPPMSGPGWPDPNANQPTSASGSQPMYPPPPPQYDPSSYGQSSYGQPSPYGSAPYPPPYGQTGPQVTGTNTSNVSVNIVGHPGVVAPSAPTNGMAIASLVLGILAAVQSCFYVPVVLLAHAAFFLVGAVAYFYVLLFLILPGLAVIFGHVGKNAIDHSGGRVGGGGLALTGLILGYIVIGLVLIGIVA